MDLCCKSSTVLTMSAYKVEGGQAFDGKSGIHEFAGILFDMDGTIVDSTEAIVKHWHKWIASHFVDCIHAYIR